MKGGKKRKTENMEVAGQRRGKEGNVRMEDERRQTRLKERQRRKGGLGKRKSYE